MRAEVGRVKAKDASNPTCGSQLAQGSIHNGDERATSQHEIAAIATSFRHSVIVSEARFMRDGESQKHWGHP
jgi:hypothetical protein